MILQRTTNESRGFSVLRIRAHKKKNLLFQKGQILDGESPSKIESSSRHQRNQRNGRNPSPCVESVPLCEDVQLRLDPSFVCHVCADTNVGVQPPPKRANVGWRVFPKKMEEGSERTPPVSLVCRIPQDSYLRARSSYMSPICTPISDAFTPNCSCMSYNGMSRSFNTGS